VEHIATVSFAGLCATAHARVRNRKAAVHALDLLSCSTDADKRKADNELAARSYACAPGNNAPAVTFDEFAHDRKPYAQASAIEADGVWVLNERLRSQRQAL